MLIYTVADFLWWGNGAFLHWMLAVSITLLILDIFFFNTDFLTLIAIGLFAAWGTMLISPPAQWGPLTFILFIAIWAGLYYGIWRKLLSPLINGYLRRHAPEDDLSAMLTDKTGTVCGQQGNYCIKVGDQMFPVAPESQQQLCEGDCVRITLFCNGMAYTTAPHDHGNAQ